MAGPARSRAERGTRKISWDVIRVIAVLAVVLGHITDRGVSNHPELAGYPFAVTAQFGASTLLVISGYFVCVTIRRGDPKRWLRGRLARVLPAFAVAVVLTYTITRFAAVSFNGWAFRHGGVFGALFGPAVATAPSVHPPWYVPEPVDLLTNLGLLQGWNARFIWLDGSYWTLPIQVAAFATAAVLWSKRWRSGDRLTLLLWSVILVPLAARLVASLDQEGLNWLRVLFAGPGLHRAYLFAAGVGVWLWSQQRMSHGHLAAMLVTVVGAAAFDSTAPVVPSTIGFAVMVVLICFAARGPDWVLPGTNWLRRPISWLAGITFCVYLVHQQLGYVVARLFVELGLPAGWIRLLAVLVAVVALGAALTVLVERPAHRLLAGGRESSSRRQGRVFVGGSS